MIQHKCGGGGGVLGTDTVPLCGCQRRLQPLLHHHLPSAPFTLSTKFARLSAAALAEVKLNLGLQPAVSIGNPHERVGGD